jgi:hypothetical protein
VLNNTDLKEYILIQGTYIGEYYMYCQTVQTGYIVGGCKEFYFKLLHAAFKSWHTSRWYSCLITLKLPKCRLSENNYKWCDKIISGLYPPSMITHLPSIFLMTSSSKSSACTVVGSICGSPVFWTQQVHHIIVLESCHQIPSPSMPTCFGKKKSHLAPGLRTEEYGGCNTTVMPFLARNSSTDKAEWAEALTRWRTLSPVPISQDVFSLLIKAFK